jgi:hypothetical protein
MNDRRKLHLSVVVLRAYFPLESSTFWTIMKNQELLVLLDARIEEIARAVFLECDANRAAVQLPNDAPTKMREQLALIKAKEHVTVKEAALLLSCSQSHVRKLVMLARKGKTRRPIPYIDMEGVTIFPRGSLLDWARPTSQIQAVKYEAA